MLQSICQYANNSDVEEISDENENSFNMITTFNKLEDPDKKELSHPASMSEYPSFNSIFNYSDDWLCGSSSCIHMCFFVSLLLS